MKKRLRYQGYRPLILQDYFLYDEIWVNAPIEALPIQNSTSKELLTHYL